MPSPQKKAGVPYEILNANAWKVDPNRDSSDEEDSSEESSESISDDEETTVVDGQNSESAEQSATTQTGFTLVQRGKKDLAPPNIPSRTPQKSTLPPQPKSRAPTTTPFTKDNAAQANFRKRLPPEKTLNLHRPVLDLEPDLRSLGTKFRELGFRHKTFIKYPTSAQDRHLDIWGRKPQVDATVKELEEWIKAIESGRSLRTKPKPKEKFAREYSTIGYQFKRFKAELAKQTALQVFQQEPPKDHKFQHSGCYLWPTEDVAPRLLFGENLEALDELRSKYEAHIILDSRQDVIRIFSDEEGSVPSILKRLEGTLCQFHAINGHGGRAHTINLVEVPPVQKLKTNVQLHQWDKPGPRYQSYYPILCGDRLAKDESVASVAAAQDRFATNAASIEDALEAVLPSLLYYHGFVKMRLHFGTFHLTDFRKPDKSLLLPVNGFVDMICESGTKGRLMKE